MASGGGVGTFGGTLSHGTSIHTYATPNTVAPIRSSPKQATTTLRGQVRHLGARLAAALDCGLSANYGLNAFDQLLRADIGFNGREIFSPTGNEASSSLASTRRSDDQNRIAALIHPVPTPTVRPHSTRQRPCI